MSDAKRIYDFMDELGMKPTQWQLQFLERWFADPKDLKPPAAQDNRPKLTKREASHIRELKRSGYKVTEIADIYDVHHGTVSRICSGIYHK